LSEGNAPDYFTPIVGWRVWLVIRNHRSIRLKSVAFRTIWHPREELHARCEGRPLIARLRRRRNHETPFEDCDCGIHAAKELGFAAGYLGTYDDLLAPILVHRVIGRVYLWGSVVEGSLGWRASAAFPAHLYVPPAADSARVDPERVAGALHDYGVPVEVLSVEEHPEIVEALIEAGQWRAAIRRPAAVVDAKLAEGSVR
jgi:hypothetical protein